MRQLDRDARILLGTDPASAEEIAAAEARSGTTLAVIGPMVGPAEHARWTEPALKPASPFPAVPRPAAVGAAGDSERVEVPVGLTRAEYDELHSKLFEAEYGPEPFADEAA